MFEYLFRNAEKSYEWTPLAVVDPDGTMDSMTEHRPDHWRKEQLKMIGVTHASQLFRMGSIEHRLRRLVTKEIDFRVPWQALALQVGDIVGIQTDVMRPYSSEALGMTIHTHPDSIYAGAVGAALWGAFRHRVLAHRADSSTQKGATT